MKLHPITIALLSLIPVIFSGGAVYCYAHGNEEAGAALVAAAIASFIPSPLSALSSSKRSRSADNDRDTDPTGER